jgi:hypothetical protein
MKTITFKTMDGDTVTVFIAHIISVREAERQQPNTCTVLAGAGIAWTAAESRGSIIDKVFK